MKKLKKYIVNKLLKKKISISVAESCSGGLLSNTITSISGSSKIFKYGIISYSDYSKNKILRIPKKVIKKYGSVSKQVCLLMVKNVNKIANTNISVSITGIAGPKGGTRTKPVGLVYIGVKKGNKINVKKYLFKNKGRSYVQKSSVKKSLELILSFIK